MESTLKDRQAVTATIDVTVDQATVDATFERVIATYARQVRVPGFRTGKAPRGVIVRRIGEEAIAEEAREALIEATYPSALREHDLQAIHAHAHGGNPEEGATFTYELHVDLYPEFEIPDPDSIVIDTDVDPVTDPQIEETVAKLRRDNATQVPVERPAAPGDVVMIETVDENGEHHDGTAMPIDLDSVDPRLAEQIVGKSMGDIFDLVLEDAHVHEGEDEAHATTTRIRIADVKEKELPEPDDTFAATMGFETWEDVIQAVRKAHEDDAVKRARQAQREEFVEKLMVGTDVPLPGYLVNRREKSLLESLAADLEKQGMNMATYLDKLTQDEKLEEFEAELKESAERAVKRDLVLEKLLELRPAEVSDAEFEEAVRYMASRERKSVEALKQEYGDEGLANYRFLLRRDKALRSTVDSLLGVVEEDPGSEPETSMEDVSAEANAEPAEATSPHDEENA